ncbi:TolC family protein [Flavicella sp.]|uniref:TolC family protein n=1 Tax=Flavicella sp. TaxID=2957742 RepID=UPI003018A092
MKRILLVVFICSFVSSAQIKKTIKVGVLSDRTSNLTIPVIDQLISEIKAVMGQEATLVFGEPLENNYDLKVAKENLKIMMDSDNDIILSIGALNAIVLHNRQVFKKPIIGFGSVNNDFVKFPLLQSTSEIDNLNYIVSPYSFTDDLDVFKTIYDYKNIAIFMEAFLIRELPVKKSLDTYFANSNATYKLIRVSESLDIIKELDGVDAVYLASDFNFGSAKRKILIDSITKRELPSFSALGISDVNKGVLATQQTNANSSQFFRRIALSFESIVSGINASELPLFIDYKKNITINYTAASKINYPLRFSMVGNVDFVRGKDTVPSVFSLSILDVMRGAVGENLDLKSEKKTRELSENEFQSAKNQYLPDLTASANAAYIDPDLAAIPLAGPEFSTTGSVTLEQLIYSPDASANKTIQKELNKAQQEVYNTAELDLLLQASLVYFNSLILKTNVNIQNQNLQVTKLNLELARQNFEEGASGKSDVLRFKSQLAQDTQSLIEAANDLKLSFNELNALINRPINTKIDIDDAEISKGLFNNYNFKKLSEFIDDPMLQPQLLEFLVLEAKLNAPELKNLAYNIKAVKRKYRLNNAGRFSPTISLRGQYNYTFNRSGVGVVAIEGYDIPDGSYNVGVNLSLPLFQQNSRTLERKSAKIQQEQLMINQENANLQISKNVNDIVSELATQIVNIRISKTAEETAKESLELTQTAYKNGAIPVIQLIDAQSNYLQAQLGSATANYGYLLTTIQLERVVGHFFLVSSTEKNKDFMERAQNYLLNKKQ